MNLKDKPAFPMAPFNVKMPQESKYTASFMYEACYGMTLLQYYSGEQMKAWRTSCGQGGESSLLAKLALEDAQTLITELEKLEGGAS